MSIIMCGGDTAGCGGAGEIEVDTASLVNFGGGDPSKGSGTDEICDDPMLVARAGDEELDELFETIGGPRVLALC